MGLVLDFLKKDSTAKILFDEDCGIISNQKLVEELQITIAQLNQIPPHSVIGVVCDLTISTVLKILACLELSHTLVLLPENTNTLEKYSFAQIEYFWQKETPPKSTHLIADHPLYTQIRQQKVSGLVLFTSSTSGESKGVVHNLTRMFQEKQLDSRKKIDSILVAMTFDHIGGLNTLFSALASRTCLYMPANRTPLHICDLVHQYKIECLPVTPSFIRLLLISGLDLQDRLASLKLMTYGAEPMPTEILQHIQQRLPSVRLKQTFGLSEVGILKTQSPNSGSNQFQLKQSASDRYRIRNGLLEIKSSNIMLGYLNAPSPITEDGWLQTNDFAIEGPLGIEIKGRASEVINVGGLKIYPTEIENLILKIPQVSDVLAYAKKNPLLGEVVAIKVVIATEYIKISPTDLRILIKKYCQNFLEKSVVPMSIDFVSEIPITYRLKKKRTD